MLSCRGSVCSFSCARSDPICAHIKTGYFFSFTPTCLESTWHKKINNKNGGPRQVPGGGGGGGVTLWNVAPTQERFGSVQHSDGFFLRVLSSAHGRAEGVGALDWA